jgi:hypothetical protein
MDGFGSTATSSAGQRTSGSPDYAPSESPRPSLFVNHHAPPRSFQLFTQSVDNEAEQESEDDDDDDEEEEVYESNHKKVFYQSKEARSSVHSNEDSEEEDEEVVYESIEHDEVNENQTMGQPIHDDDSKSEHRDVRSASVSPPESPKALASSPTSKLLASCLDTDQPFLHEYLFQRKELVVQFLQRNNDFVECFLTKNPDFVVQFLRRNQQQARTLFVEDPTWYVEQHLNKYPYLLYNYLMEHPADVEILINANPTYFDQYLIRHPEFAVNYLHFNRLPSGFGIPPDMFGITSVVMPPPPRVQAPSSTSAGLPSPNSSPPPPQPPLPPSPPPPILPPNASGPVRQPTSRIFQATRKPPTNAASPSQQSLPKAVPGEAKPKTAQQPRKPALDPASAPIPSDEAPTTPDSGPQKTAGPSWTKNALATATSSSSNGSAQAQTYRVLLTSSYGQTAGEFMGYPAPAHLLAASREQEAGTKGSWRLFEEDRAIKHMLDVRDEARLAGESRFEEVSTRLKAEGIERGFFAVKNYWNRTGRARSGFDERKNKTAPLATSKQGKAFRQKKAKGDSKRKSIRVESDDEEDEEDSEYSVHSEEEDTPLPPRRAPPPPPVPAPAPAPVPAPSAIKRPADHDDEALAWAMSRGTRPKKQRTG